MLMDLCQFSFTYISNRIDDSIFIQPSFATADKRITFVIKVVTIQLKNYKVITLLSKGLLQSLSQLNCSFSFTSLLFKTQIRMLFCHCFLLLFQIPLSFPSMRKNILVVWNEMRQNKLLVECFANFYFLPQVSPFSLLIVNFITTALKICLVPCVFSFPVLNRNRIIAVSILTLPMFSE